MAGFQAVIGFPRFRSVGVPYTPPTPPSPPEGSPSAPQSLTALAAPNAVVLSWSFPSSTGTSSITKWNIYQGTVSGGETLLTGQSAQTQYGPNTYNCGAACTGLTAGDRYYFKVTAVNTAGEGGASNEVSAVAGAAVAMQAPDYFADNNMSEPIPFPNAVYSKPLSSTTPSYFPNGVPKAGNSSLLISNLESQYTNEGYGRPYINEGSMRYVVNADTSGAADQTVTLNPNGRWDDSPQGPLSVSFPPPSTSEPVGWVAIPQTDHSVMVWNWNNGSSGKTTYSIWANTTEAYDSTGTPTTVQEVTPVINGNFGTLLANTAQVINSDDTNYPGFGPGTITDLSSSSSAVAMPFIATNITLADYNAGVIAHMMYITVGSPTGYPVNPAPASDGVNMKSIANGGIPEGTVFVMPGSVSNPGVTGFTTAGSNAPQLATYMFTCLQSYGMIAGDSNAGNGINFQFENFRPWNDYNPTKYPNEIPPNWPFNNDQSPWGGGALFGMPWTSMFAAEPGCLWPPTLTDNNGAMTAAIQDAEGIDVTSSTTSITLNSSTSLNDLVIVDGMVGPVATTGNTISGLGATWVKVHETTETYAGNNEEYVAFRWIGYGCAAGDDILTTNFTAAGTLSISRWSGFGATNPIIASSTPYVDNTQGVKSSFPTNSVSTTATGQIVLGGCYVGFQELTENAFGPVGELNYGGTTWSNGIVNRHIMNGYNQANSTFQNFIVPTSTGAVTATMHANGYTGYGGFITILTVLQP